MPAVLPVLGVLPQLDEDEEDEVPVQGLGVVVPPTGT